MLGETLITGIGQGYFQTTPIQLCLMIAQLANGGYMIKPRIIDDRYKIQPVIDAWKNEFALRRKNSEEISMEEPVSDESETQTNYKLQKLYRNLENVKFVRFALLLTQKLRNSVDAEF